MKKTCCVIIMILMVSFLKPIYASNNNSSFSIYDGVMFSLPDKWISIPKDTINEAMKAFSDQTKVAAVEYDCGFQLDNGEGFFSYPYILIQIHNEQRVPESELSTYTKTAQESLGSALDSTQKELSSQISTLKLGETTYSSSKKRMIALMDLATSNNEISCVMVTQFTQNGYFNIYFYTQKDEYSLYSNTVSSIVNSIVIRPDLLYLEAEQPNISKNASVNSTADNAVIVPKRILSKAISGGLVGLFFGGIIIIINAISKIQKTITRRKLKIEEPKDSNNL